MKMWEIEDQINGRGVQPVAPSFSNAGSLANAIPQRTALSDAAATLSMSCSLASMMASCMSFNRNSRSVGGY
ncbi:hypothetical protein GOEFS_094_00280 [Gordonia effusa NBRC 100432]|uniref:Uncharacterized protein n=1 Tax=Gordonia effusa NBRC 100432 TaxID=1077974 RepID=H0R3S8_9ACTN|nr:hypothetical protein [Gordonia effusa]GAB19729.1 hypothetical protein GOEFS_094_00280 [Gordonia effusa NBRC 100432]